MASHTKHSSRKAGTIITLAAVAALGTAGALYYADRLTPEIKNQMSDACQIRERGDCIDKESSRVLVAPKYAHGTLLTFGEANKFLDDLVKTRMPGTLSACVTPNADKALLHIRKGVYAPNNSSDIEKILQILAKDGIQDVYCEGVTPEMASILNWQSKLIKWGKGDRRALLKQINKETAHYRIELMDHLNESKLLTHQIYNANAEQLREQLKREPVKKDYLADAKHRYEHDPIFRLAAQGVVHINGAESINSWLLGEITRDGAMQPQADRHKSAAYMDYYETREQMFLDVASRHNGPVVIVYWDGRSTFGGLKTCGEEISYYDRETYRDNIYGWNSKHSQKFSIADYTPRNFK
jgi:hypothetical protein